MSTTQQPTVKTISLSVKDEKCFETKTYYKDLSASNATWQEKNASDDYLHVRKTEDDEYKTVIKTKNCFADIPIAKLISAKLVLPIPFGNDGYDNYSMNQNWKDLDGIIIDEVSENFSITSSGNVEINLIDYFIAYSTDFELELSAVENCDYRFERELSLKVDYIEDENVFPVKKQYELSGTANAEYDIGNRKMTITFCDVKPQDSPMGTGVYHTYRKSNDDNFAGKYFKLNLHEKFNKINDTLYMYTDSCGNKYSFREYFYYISTDGVKTYIGNKSNIQVDTKGKLTYTLENKQYEVICEYKSNTGLRAVTELCGLKHLELYDQRSEEQKQVNANIEECLVALKNFVIYNVSSNSNVQGYELKNKIKSYDGAVDFIKKAESSSNYVVLPDGETDYSINHLEWVKNYIKEYFELLEEKEQLKVQTPINFLTDEKTVKGYNENGDLVAIYDKHDNYVVIEYEKIPTSDEYRIARTYDNFDKQNIFEYDSNSQLTSVTNSRGKKINYIYDSNGYLVKVVKDGVESIELNYGGNYDNLISIANLKAGLKSEFTYKYDRLTAIANYSTLTNVSMKEATECIELISKVVFQYLDQDIDNIRTKIYDGEITEDFTFDGIGSCVEYIKAENNVVVKAEQYDNVPYWIGNVAQENPKKVIRSTVMYELGWYYLEDFTFENYDTETIYYNQFNKPVRSETTPVRISYVDASTGPDNIIEKFNYLKTTVDYEYNDEQKLIKERTTKVYTSNIEHTTPDDYTIEEVTLKTDVFITTYTYNDYDEIIRVESWVDGEELVNGKTVEETVYDDKGNIVKTITYNTLDSSSKYYTETEHNKNGKIIAEFDGTGENKKEYIYSESDGQISEEKLPNGSKFAYGYSADGTVTAISQSTEIGEENSTQKIYNHGQLVQITSGNNKVKYTYGNNRELSAIELNGKENYETFAYTVERNDNGAITKKTITKTDKNGDVIVTELNSLGQVLNIEFNGVPQVENTYNRSGKISKTVAADGASYTFSYDDYDRLKSVGRARIDGYLEPNSCGENYTHDEFGNLTKKKFSGRVTHEYNYAYKTDSTGALEKITVNGYSVKPQTDALGRNIGKKIVTNNTILAEEQITYKKIGNHATTTPSSLSFGHYDNDIYVLKDNIKYSYDNMGNVNKIYENGKLVVRYTYDALNRLVREDNLPLDKTVVMVYDNCGNIIKQKIFAFSLKDEELLEENSSTEKEYIYDGDKLISFNGQACEYDEIGNPTTYRGKSAYWGYNRRLDGYDDNLHNYDGAGKRTTCSSIELTYDINGNIVKTGEGLEFFYDHTGISSVKHNGIIYFYRKDIFGNIIALIDNINGDVAVRYIYDAWGNHKVVDKNGNEITSATHIGNLNPFRYRSYFYDTGSKLYYLKSRDYDPETGRFLTLDNTSYINPDVINGLNLYSYCGNNPVMNVDPSGTAWWHWALGAVVVVGLAVATAVTAGGAAAGLIAIAAAASGTAVFGTTTTVLAFATVGAATALTATALVAGADSIETVVSGGDFADGLDTFASHGETALLSTVTFGVVSAVGGYATFKQRIGNDSQLSHMTSSQRTAQRYKYWKTHGNKTGIAPTGLQISHIYGTFGNNREFFIIQTVEEHRAFHAIYGYKTAGGAFNRYNPNYPNFWILLKRALGGF